MSPIRIYNRKTIRINLFNFPRVFQANMDHDAFFSSVIIHSDSAVFLSHLV